MNEIQKEFRECGGMARREAVFITPPVFVSTTP
jgi:hypothetical protein